jgi:hypothetical protein
MGKEYHDELLAQEMSHLLEYQRKIRFESSFKITNPHERVHNHEMKALKDVERKADNN